MLLSLMKQGESFRKLFIWYPGGPSSGRIPWFFLRGSLLERPLKLPDTWNQTLSVNGRIAREMTLNNLRSNVAAVSQRSLSAEACQDSDWPRWRWVLVGRRTRSILYDVCWQKVTWEERAHLSEPRNAHMGSTLAATSVARQDEHRSRCKRGLVRKHQQVGLSHTEGRILSLQDKLTASREQKHLFYRHLKTNNRYNRGQTTIL